jgi:protease PrsW
MKLSLTIKSGTLAGRIYDLSVGRSEGNTVRFEPLTEKIASKQHAAIEARPDGFYLIDKQSTNGTLLNGTPIQIARLNSGDTIQFGRNGIEASVSIESQPEFAPDATIFQPKTDFGSFQPQPQTGFQPQPPADFQPQFEMPAPTPTISLRNSVSGMGLGHIDVQPEKSQNKKYIIAGLTIFGVVFLSLIVILLMVFSVGLVNAVFASFVAFIPAMFYLLPLVWLDRYDPEPIWLLALAFAWGALVSVIVSFIINTAVGIGFGSIDPALGVVAGAVISAPVVEEASKGLGLVLLLIFFRREFDDILDGIVYAGVIALGFATVENVLYYGRGIAGGGAAGLIVLFVLRGILSPFAHVTFTAMTGIGCGIARESHNTLVKILLPVIGYGCAVLLHAFWNGVAVVGGLGGFILSYLFLQIPFFLIFVGFSFYIMRRQNKILREMLALDVARGLIPQDHYERATSAFRSTGWLVGSIFKGKYKPTSRYLRSIGKLGLSYWHIQRATAAQGNTGSFQQNPILRDEVLKWRDQV